MLKRVGANIELKLALNTGDGRGIFENIQENYTSTREVRRCCVSNTCKGCANNDALEDEDTDDREINDKSSKTSPGTYIVERTCAV